VNTTERYDYVVVGAGSAGCAVAGRLSEDPDVTVAVIEAGPPATGRLFEIPRLFGLQLKTSYDWDFTSEPEAQLNGRRNYLPRGRVVGGTSSMNTQLYVRGNRADYDAWRDLLGLDGWGYDDVLPFFKRSEDNERGESAYHGVGGPLRVSDARSIDPLLTSWVTAAEQAGHPRNDDFNGEHQDGVGVFQLTQKDGLRWSAAKAFLEPAEGRPNLTVLPLTLALRLRVEQGRVTGVEVEHQARTRTIEVGREVIVSAGAYLSPQLLMLSGIGPADELRSHGIAPVVDNPEVGRNLQDHPGCFMSLPAISQDLPDPDTSEAEALLRAEGTGPMTWTEVGGFFRTAPEKPHPDIQFHAALGIVREEGLSSGADLGLGFGPYVGCPKSRGRVTLRSAVPHAKPHIHHNYLAEPEDLELLRVGMRMAMEIARQPALTAGTGLKDLDGATADGLAPRSDSDADIDAFVRQYLFSFYHPTGTCSMGKVVDERLKVRGVENLRVADASVIPLEPIGNLNAPCIMIGERAADFIRSGR
jgi:choline dehydrogenase-like flavoprotein